MLHCALMRFLRRRIVLGVIFALSLAYCLFALLLHDDGRRRAAAATDEDDDSSPPHRRVKPFVWRTLLIAPDNSSANAVDTCRNSVQGKSLIVDERGYVCRRRDVGSRGCCETTRDIHQYSCRTCAHSRCCAVYEYCVACCLHPDNRELLQRLLDEGEASRRNGVIFASVNDHFELCSVKCRTDSTSVRHENSYRDPKRKHCFGPDAPT